MPLRWQGGNSGRWRRQNDGEERRLNGSHEKRGDDGRSGSAPVMSYRRSSLRRGSLYAFSPFGWQRREEKERRRRESRDTEDFGEGFRLRFVHTRDEHVLGAEIDGFGRYVVLQSQEMG
ncbi:hypothetical protein Dda_2175 [Drechslerella dactyloides]|uniref:Uncharacterized protein n=1 Tax=Drechslerella dactyloides TaxID=74499 RepID=A0AAD6J759_DREDA|nr:hypothetical protein Dda_2175 [Drechslerella dactyloides]